MLDPIFKEITTPLARELAEYALLRLDLESALNGLTVPIRLTQTPPISSDGALSA